MKRHLVVVELDSRLFDAVGDAAMYVQQTIAHALRGDTPRLPPGTVDLRPVVACAGDDNRGVAFRWADQAVPEVATTELDDGAQLGLASTAALVAELCARAELGNTDRGLDYRTTIDA